MADGKEQTLPRNTELARAVNIVMVQTKIIFIYIFLLIKVNKLFFFVSSWYCRKEMKNMFSVLLNTCENLGKLEKALESLS